MVIITAGMIGVGKTTLTGKIADHLHILQEPETIWFFTANLLFKQTVLNDQKGFE